MEPSHQDVNTLLTLFNQGDYPKMENLARTMTMHYPRFGIGWKALGTALLQQGKSEEALVPLQQASVLLPGDAGVYNNLGCIFNIQGKFIEAEASLNQALTLKPDFAEAHYSLGNTLQAQGRLLDAEASYQRALDIRPDYAEAHSNLGVNLKDQNRYSEAIQHLLYAQSQCITPKSLGYVCALLGEKFDTLNKKWLQQIFSHACVLVESGTNSSLHRELLAILKFGEYPGSQYDSYIYEYFALPSLKWMLKTGRYSAGLDMESAIYTDYTKKTETESQFKFCFSQWTDEMSSAGKCFAATLPPHPDRQITLKAPYKIAFFIHSSSMLAHIEVLINMLRGYRKQDFQPFIPLVYSFAEHDDVMNQAFADCCVQVIELDQVIPNSNIEKKLAYLRFSLHKDNVQTLVWISAALMMPFVFSMRIAPVQIWWAMKYHSLDFGEIDGYLALGGLAPYKNIGNQCWRSIPYMIADLFDPLLTSEAMRLRSKYGSTTIVLGSFGREEKLDSIEFNAVVVDLLKTYPQAIFLWTGKTPLKSILNRFDQAGVADRCHFIGWVNTRLWAQVVDIFLDSFPFPNGLTVMQAMAAGKPTVFFKSAESMETGLPGMFLPALDGTDEFMDEKVRETIKKILQPNQPCSLFLCADNPVQYRAYAASLIENENYRLKVGQAMRQLAQDFISDPVQMAKQFTTHIIELTTEKLFGYHKV